MSLPPVALDVYRRILNRDPVDAPACKRSVADLACTLRLPGRGGLASFARAPTPIQMKAPGFELQHFDLSAVLRCGIGLQRAGWRARTMEEAAEAVVRYLYASAQTDQGDPACALIRLFTTLPFEDLPPELQRSAERAAAGAELAPGTRCLTLLGTAGEEPAWNDRTQSLGHQAIPLTSHEMVDRAPMIARLLQELGVDVGALLDPVPGLLDDLVGKSYNVFHVERAMGSPYIPAQDFVLRHGVHSVIGFGGLLPRADLFAVILFSRVHVGQREAERFRKVATDVKSLLYRYDRSEVFALPRERTASGTFG